MIAMNRQWLLKRRPQGKATIQDFEYVEATLPATDDLRPGEIVLRNLVFLCAPTMRNWMDPPSNSLYPSMPLGAPVMAPAACEVIASRRPDVPVGSRVTSLTAWQDCQRVSPDHSVSLIPDDLDTIEAMGVLGLNTLTAYFGLLRVGSPAPGETVVVSGAAGSTGSVAAQIAKLNGCRVVGVAGGSSKCRWLLDDLGLDAAVDYKDHAFEARMREACPRGIDVFFDNVGGAVLQAAVDNMARRGRIVLCGQIAGYNDSAPVPGPRDMMRLIYGSITMRGFLMSDYADEVPVALSHLRAWLASRQLKVRVDARAGFRRIPETFAALFEGANQGTLLALVDRPQ